YRPSRRDGAAPRRGSPGAPEPARPNSAGRMPGGYPSAGGWPGSAACWPGSACWPRTYGARTDRPRRGRGRPGRAAPGPGRLAGLAAERLTGIRLAGMRLAGMRLAGVWLIGEWLIGEWLSDGAVAAARALTAGRRVQARPVIELRAGHGVDRLPGVTGQRPD